MKNLNGIIKALEEASRKDAGKLVGCSMCEVREGRHEADCPLRSPYEPTQPKKEK